MADGDHDPASPPKSDVQSTPSIYAYRTRLLSKQDASQDVQSSFAGNGSSPSRAPTVSRMNSLREEATVGGLRRAGSGARIGSHTRGGKSVDLVRNQWEAKIEAAAVIEEPTPQPIPRPRSMYLASTATAQASQSTTPPPATTTPTKVTPSAAASESFLAHARSTSALRPKRATVDGVPGWNPPSAGAGNKDVKFPGAAEQTSSPVEPEGFVGELPRFPRDRPSSITSYATISPNVTGQSTMSLRNKSSVDTLAEARANALRRLEAKKKAGVVVQEPQFDLPPVPQVPPKVEINLEDFAPVLRTVPSSRQNSITEAEKQSVLLPKTSHIINQTPSKAPTPTKPTDRSVMTLPTPAPSQGSSDTAPKPSPFGERLRPAPKSLVAVQPVTQAGAPATSPTPFGERLKAAQRREPVVLPNEVSKPEPELPTLRKTKSINLGAPNKPPPPTLADRLDALKLAESKPIEQTKRVQTRRSVDEIRRSLNTPSEIPKTVIDLPKRIVSDSPILAAQSTGDEAAPSPKAATPKPKLAGLGFRAPTGPPKGTVSSLANRWTSGEVGAAPSPRARVPSRSHDGRSLGKHLPRIVSGDMGWEGDAVRGASAARKASVKGRKTSLSRSTPMPLTEVNTPPRPRAEPPVEVLPVPSVIPSPARPAEPLAPLAPSAAINTPTPTTPSTPSKKSSKSNLYGSLTPRAEVHGAEMKGLMSAISAAPARQGNDDGGEGVTGMSNRVRLSQRLPLAASSVKVAPAPLPSRRLAGNNNWMDRQRHALAAYEYLCHIGEAQQWIEGCLDEELEFGVTEMEEGLRDGIALAKLARVFQGEQVVRRIWTEAKHRFRQSDNINYFLNFIRSVGMPETFIFELTDLYNKKNIPKVIFCIHVLSHLLARLGRAERMNNLVGQFEFTDEQLAATQKGIQGVAMPNFQQVGQTLAKEASWEPEPEEEVEEETEDERELPDRLPECWLTPQAATESCLNVRDPSFLSSSTSVVPLLASVPLVSRHSSSSPPPSLFSFSLKSVATGLVPP